MRRAAGLPVLLALLVLLSSCGGPGETPPPSASTPSVSASASPSDAPSEEPSLSPSPDESEPPTATPAETPTGTVHVVRAGDTLSAIARAYGTTVEQLQAWNQGRYPSLATNPSVIEPGWELIVSGEPGVTPQPTPTAAPATPKPTAPPSGGGGCRAGNRVAAGGIQVFRTIPNAGPGVALTFDMGGRMDPAVDIMNFLVANRVCATIFATGVMSQTAQGQQVMAIIKAHPELFEIANHTMYHCDLVRGGGGSPTTAPCTGSFDANRIRKEMTDAESILRGGTGQNPQPYWRPPYGSVNDAVLSAVAAAGYTKTFLWDIDTIDWKPMSDGGPSAEQIASKVIGNAVNGSNVLFHLGGFETLDSLRLIVPGLRDRGFTLTSLSDLLN
ncbi:MAG TPA: polysaccharide deacetylase family protein [Candidatus Limnocylindria bacterium]|nr:polysaccharide deacetylase family protein [Candidatus Limnocylindria bacterium]